MKCENCGSKLKKKFGELKVIDDYIGPYSAENVPYF